MQDWPSIDGIELIREIGAGSAGIVFQGRMQHSKGGLNPGDDVAVKVFKEKLEPGTDSQLRFQRELEIGQAADHPNLMKTHFGGECADELPYVVMELLDGRPLEDELADGGLFEEDRTRAIALGIASGLEMLHSAGNIHRDLKPANVMVTRQNAVKLTDYGLARNKGISMGITQKGIFLGTLRYAAPEQLGGVAGLSSDIWSVGCIIYEMLTGSAPYPQEDLFSLIAAIQAGNAKPIQAVRDDVSEEMIRMVTCCLAPDPASRFAEAKELAAALEGRPGPRLKRFMEAVSIAPAAKPEGHARIPRTTTFIGRSKEKLDLTACVESDDCRVALVTGFGGTGKTALVGEFAREAEASVGRRILYFDGRAENLDWLTIHDAMSAAVERWAGVFLEPGDLPAVLASEPCMVIFDSIEAFDADDWSSITEFLKTYQKIPREVTNHLSTVILSGRARPAGFEDLDASEITLEGLPSNLGAELLSQLVRDRGPRAWINPMERAWVSARVGGHPEMLRMIARLAVDMDYSQLRVELARMEGKLLEKLEGVIVWSVERLGDEGKRLLPFHLCFEHLSYESGELAAAAGMHPSDDRFRTGLDQLQNQAGLIRYDPDKLGFTFNASLLEWARAGLQEKGHSFKGIDFLGLAELQQANGRVADYWENLLYEMEENPEKLTQMLPTLMAIRKRMGDTLTMGG